PLFREVLCELVRVDLEYGWKRGKACPLSDYQRRYPVLFRDAEAANKVAFEEFRLRLQAGDRPSARDYEERFGVDTSGWPMEEAASPVYAPEPARSAEELARELRDADPPRGQRLQEALINFPAPGQTVCGFRLVSELGRGSFGRVFLAQ